MVRLSKDSTHSQASLQAALIKPYEGVQQLKKRCEAHFEIFIGHCVAKGAHDAHEHSTIEFNPAGSESAAAVSALGTAWWAA